MKIIKKNEFKTYLSLCSEYYDLDKPKAPKQALDFYMQFAKQVKGHILEPMCGTGSFLLPILKEGFSIKGFDASSQMLLILNRKAKEQGLSPNVWKQFLEASDEMESYDLIFIPLGSFGLIIEEKAAEDYLKKVYLQLNQNGKFVFEVETFSSAFEESNSWKVDVRHRNEHDYITLSTFQLAMEGNISTTLCKYELIESEEVKESQEEVFKLRLYEVGDLVEKLLKIGFSKITMHKAYDYGVEPGSSDEVVVYECLKE
jgi:hypothetical protein